MIEERDGQFFINGCAAGLETSVLISFLNYLERLDEEQIDVGGDTNGILVRCSREEVLSNSCTINLAMGAKDGSKFMKFIAYFSSKFRIRESSGVAPLQELGTRLLSKTRIDFVPDPIDFTGQRKLLTLFTIISL